MRRNDRATVPRDAGSPGPVPRSDAHAAEGPRAMARRPRRNSDAIRIVPLIGTAVAARAVPAAHLTNRNGPLLTAVEITTIFWGSWWKTAPQDALVGRLNAFFDDILVSALIDQLKEYSVPGKSIGHGRRTSTLTVDTSPATTVDDSAIVAFLEGLLAAGSVPKASANSLYFIYLPSGVSVTAAGQASCQQFCGYHDVTAKGGIYYAVEPYPDCQGCLANLSDFDALTVTSSHELCEAITDPVPGQGWYDDANGEIGDICPWQTKTVDSYTVQLEWSNASSTCA